MTLRLYQVDAFAERIFEGNPAAVCLLDAPLPSATMQAIAQENDLSETAFFRPDEERPRLRWFSPEEEVPLCGHATLAAGFVVLERLAPDRSSITFETRSGALSVHRDGDRLRLEVPAVRFEKVGDPPPELAQGLGTRFREVLRTPDDPNYLVVLGDEEEVAGVTPDLRVLEEVHPFGVAVSAPGREVDFVSRYFAPGWGIPEDPVTGSIHCALGPYWSRRLEKDEMTARQLSRRGGALQVRVSGEWVHLTGRVRLYLEGEVHLPRT